MDLQGVSLLLAKRVRAAKRPFRFIYSFPVLYMTALSRLTRRRYNDVVPERKRLDKRKQCDMDKECVL